jgi:threonine synthase
LYRLKCISCEKEYKVEAGRYTCDDCGPLLGTLEVIYPLNELKIDKTFKKKASVFQFEALLPTSSHTLVDEFVGGTPLIEYSNTFNQDTLYIKFDGISFSGSYKDRASIIAINKAIEEGNDHIFCASTGNAASSLALLNAHTNLKTTIFVPDRIPKGKLAQLKAAGADVLLISASYDEVFDLSLEIGLKNGWYTRNSAINPYLLEGKKTGAFEILVQLDYEAPDYILVGVGDGTIVSALCKAVEEFFALGLIAKKPKIIGVQAEGSATLKKVYDKGEPFIPIIEDVETMADSICVGNPRDVIKACKYMKKNGGHYISVTDDSIKKAIIDLASVTGVFSEPAGAVTLAGLQSLQGNLIKKSDKVCLIVTGNGLKDVEAVPVSKETSISVAEVRKQYGR